MLLRQPVRKAKQLVFLSTSRLLLLASALLATSAQAAPKRPPAPPTHDQKQEKIARGHFERAESAFNLGRFDEALTGYQAAYEALPLPAFLFNIAQCHRNLRNREQAVFFYQRYLSLAPDAPNRPTVEDLIAEQKGQLEAQRRAAAAPVEPAHPVDLELHPEGGEAAVANLERRPPEEPRNGGWKTGRWMLLGALGAALIGGVALLVIRTGGTPPSGSLGNIDTR
jgi:tetratricopeptide (TPR) repeat protein